MTKSMKLFLLPILVGFLLLSSGCSEIDEIEKDLKEEQNQKFTLSEDHGYTDEYGIAYYIEGKVTNNTDKSYSYVQVSFNVYDSEGNNIGSCFDNINNLDANGTWKIKAICSGDANSVSRYEITEFTSW